MNDNVIVRIQNYTNHFKYVNAFFGIDKETQFLRIFKKDTKKEIAVFRNWDSVSSE